MADVPDVAEREALLGLIVSFREGRLSLDEFYRQFYFRYADLPEESMSAKDWDFFGPIHEKLDFVAENPDKLSRRDGWISSSEFKAWLADFLTDHGQYPQISVKDDPGESSCP